MMSVANVWQLIDSLAHPVTTSREPLPVVLGRILRENITAPADEPAFNRSSIDGYAVLLSETAPRLRLIGATLPGESAAQPPGPGTAIQVFTGSAIPESEDVGLVMIEDTHAIDDATIELRQAPSADLIRRRGSHMRAGAPLLSEGQCLTPGSMALLASIGAMTPLVSRTVRIAHLATGRELIAPEANPATGQIRDSNSTLIAALLAQPGMHLGWQQRVDDDRLLSAKALADALATEPDILLISGGSSVGAHDHTAVLLRENGFTLHCQKVASRPGKPLIVASRGRQLAFGLPGNPLSHFVCFHVFVRRAIARLQGAEPNELMPVAIPAGLTIPGDARESWWPCRLDHSTGAVIAHPLEWKDSSDLRSLAQANALLRRQPDAAADTRFLALQCQ